MAARARVGSDMWGRCGIRRARGTRWAGADNLYRRTWWAVWSWTRRSWSWSGWAVWTWVTTRIRSYHLRADKSHIASL